MGTGAEPIEVLLERIRKKRATVKRWQDCQFLIIDEISMISGSFFEKLEKIAREVRGNSQPFGGIQLILCGDFFQLPPVNDPLFCFEASSWDSCVHEYIDLKQV
jgi:ATP-dependent DNA helicase PIF1